MITYIVAVTFSRVFILFAIYDVEIEKIKDKIGFNKGGQNDRR
ncbi:hypothetical protein BJV85_000116 [Clostridium acetobutylicum]|nr:MULTISPECIES: hypothetical protein [Clostridium]NOV87145.1 hypothetical protein [Clostridium acetobutylicum]NOW14509.1 hypothetical protein [Clostridium acetobutylicum]NRY58524.1 hypothetical protein [Clostridium acetobutylicum]NSA91270.1 hypothetical protein [Clostridium acetobutylicum]NYC92204.1 hypothetical protein [Clostridium acetobutylicum]